MTTADRATLILAVVPRLRRDKWENEDMEYTYRGGMLYAGPECSRVGNFDTLDDALTFLKREMRATIMATGEVDA